MLSCTKTINIHLCKVAGIVTKIWKDLSTIFPLSSYRYKQPIIAFHFARFLISKYFHTNAKAFFLNVRKANTAERL